MLRMRNFASAHVPGTISNHMTFADLGLSEDLLHSPFEAFQTTKATGMGLGLSICQTIVEAHGSSIQVASEPGTGACFTFTLRIASDVAM